MCFNPRTRKGCDRELIWSSIQTGSFNPRTRKGCDQTPTLLDVCWKFQSTHPQGVRLTEITGDVTSNVSIHAPARGATKRDAVFGYRIVVSIHAPARGATGRQYALALTGRFQSTHPQGVRPSRSRRPLTTTLFQSTHPQGVRPR